MVQHTEKESLYRNTDYLTSVELNSPRLVKTPRSVQSLAILLIVIVVCVTMSLIFVPWQQSVVGIGKVIVFSPMERPQNIEAQIPARLVKWNVVEGQQIKSGQVIAELADLDSKFLDIEQPKKLETQKEALLVRREAAQLRAQALEAQINAVSNSRDVAIPSAKERALQTKDRLVAAQQALQASEQNLSTSQLNLTRLRELHTKGLRSKRDLELVELDYVKAQTDVERAKSALEVARRDTIVGELDQTKIANDMAATLSSISASLASAKETIASINNDLVKLEVDLQNVYRRFEQRLVSSPYNGQVVRLMRAGAGETVKSGDVLAVIVPETTDQAVEVYLTDNDAPLVSVGRPVRLQFAGWPAIQFTGWPSIAVGTFGGRIAVIDAVDDGKSKYRIIVKPDLEAIKNGIDEPWPSSKFLRPGTEASGWVMLDTVSLGFELWRQFNAFPPTVSREILDTKDSKPKAKDESK